MSYLFNNKVRPDDSLIDAFNRIRVSQPNTIFDSQHRYAENDKWDTTTQTGASSTYVANESAITLAVNGSSGSKVVRETKRVFPYQPGKSLLVLNSFAFSAKLAGLRLRLGYFGTQNGAYLEQDGTTVNLVLRSYTSGSLNEIRVAQANWNGDTFNGTGLSGRNLDLSKTNILWMDFEWLGVGDVRVGFFVDGKPVIAHTFHNDNINTTTYMTTAILPIRFEMENTANTGIASTAKQICSSVISEAGYEAFNRVFGVDRGAKAISTSDYTPMISIRLHSDRLDYPIIPAAISASTVSANRVIQYQLIKNVTTLTTPSWVTHSNGNVQYDISANTLSGGTVIFSGYLQSGTPVTLPSVNNFNFQLGRTLNGVSDTFTIALKALDNAADVYTNFSWYELA